MGNKWGLGSLLSGHKTFTGCSNIATHFAIIGKVDIINGYCDDCWPDFEKQVKELNKEEVLVANILMR